MIGCSEKNGASCRFSMLYSVSFLLTVIKEKSFGSREVTFLKNLVSLNNQNVRKIMFSILNY